MLAKWIRDSPPDCFLLYVLQAMFHYKSNLLKTLTTMFYFLPMIMGLSEEKQVVELRLFDDYLENSVGNLVNRVGDFLRE